MIDTLSRDPQSPLPARDLHEELLTRLVHKFARSIGAIRSTTQALMNGADEEPELRREMIRDADAELQELQRVIDNVVQLRAFEKGTVHLRRTTILPSLFIWSAVEAWRGKPAAGEFVWDVDISDELEPIHADPDRFQQILDNLMGNAIRHSPGGGRIRVTAGAEEGMLVFRLETDASRLRPDEYERLFDPFYTGQHQGRFPVGPGLGLHVARLLVKELGGTLGLHPAADDGRRMVLSMRLPQAAAGSADGNGHPSTASG